MINNHLAAIISKAVNFCTGKEKLCYQFYTSPHSDSEKIAVSILNNYTNNSASDKKFNFSQ